MFDGEAVKTSISIPKSLKDFLEELAEEENRDLSNQIEFMVIRDIKANYSYRPTKQKVARSRG